MTSKKTGYLLGVLAGGVIVTGAMAGAAVQLPNAKVGDARFIQASTAPIFAPPPGAPLSFADIFEQVSPAVVSINVTSKVDPGSLRRQIPGLPFDIVPRGAPEGDEEDAPSAGKGKPTGKAPTQQSAGSGFFISADGYIVTNNHVVENADEIKVVLKDERELDAVVVGRDEGTDLAVIKVKGSGFTFVNFENSAKPRVGDWVITVGNPFGLGGTATAGIISAYGRDIGETFVDYIQIDAPINRGNSGGPTFDVYGRVIGVNTAIFSPSGGSVGIGFAIPADVADNITKKLIAGGKVTRGYIGASIQNFTSEMAEAQGLPGQKGAIVADLVPGGPSQKAGLSAGDLVVSVNGQRVRTSAELTREVAKASPGDVLHLDILRMGKAQTVDIRSGIRPSEKELASNDNKKEDQGPGKSGGSAKSAVIGLTFAPLDDPTRRRLGIEGAVKGVVISAVDPNSDAAQKGVRPDDILVRAGDREVASVADFAAVVDAAKKASRQSVLVGIYRGGRTLFLPLKVAG